MNVVSTGEVVNEFAWHSDDLVDDDQCILGFFHFERAMSVRVSRVRPWHGAHYPDSSCCCAVDEGGDWARFVSSFASLAE